MKKIVLLVLTMVTSWTMVKAEVTHAIGLQVGFERQLYMLNSPSSKDSKTHLNKEPLNGAKLGFVYEATFIKGFGLYTALNYSFTGHTSNWAFIEVPDKGVPGRYTPSYRYEYKYKAEAHTLDLNLEFQYKFEIAGNTYLTLLTGPSAQFIAKYDAKDFFRDNITGEETGKAPIYVIGYNADEMEKYYKRWNVSWGVGAGFQYDRYYLRFTYNFGLVNPYTKDAFKDMDIPYDCGDRLTRGRLDDWSIRLGVFLWRSDK